MESDRSEGKVSAYVRPPVKKFRERFALRWWPDIVLVIVVVVLVGARVWKHSQQAAYEGILRRPLRVGIVSWPGYAGGLVANKGLGANKDSDFWNNKDHPLLVEFVLVEDETELLREFAQGGDKGGLDVMWSTVDSLAQQIPTLEKMGLRPRAFMQVDWSRGADAIVARADIKRIEQLTDKKIAVSQAASQWLFEYSLERAHMEPDDRQKIRKNLYRTKGSEEACDLFIAGKVDAAALWEPDVTNALNGRTRARILIDTSAADKLIADVMVANEDFIRRHPDAIAAFIKGWLSDGTPKAISDPMLAVQVLMQNESKFSELGEETTRKLLAKAPLATFSDNVEMFGLSGGDALFDRIFRQASATWVAANYITAEVNPEQVRDESFLRELYIPPERGCREYATSILPIAFSPGEAELSPDARKILDDEKFSVQLSSHSGVRFCVEASAEVEGDPQRSRVVSRAREEAIITYLRDRYILSKNQFVAANGDACEKNDGEKAMPCIRLKVIGPGGR